VFSLREVDERKQKVFGVGGYAATYQNGMYTILSSLSTLSYTQAGLHARLA
jgi:hypothetical protein